MVLPYLEPLTPRQPAPRVIPEPPRRGEPGGEPCGICGATATDAVWSDEHFTLHPPVGGSLPGTVWLATRPTSTRSRTSRPRSRAAFGPLAGRIERAILALGDVGRVHLYRWGDGGAHFHVWFMPRPLGMLEAKGIDAAALGGRAAERRRTQSCVEAAERVAAAL